MKRKPCEPRDEVRLHLPRATGQGGASSDYRSPASGILTRFLQFRVCVPCFFRTPVWGDWLRRTAQSDQRESAKPSQTAKLYTTHQPLTGGIFLFVTGTLILHRSKVYRLKVDVWSALNPKPLNPKPLNPKPLNPQTRNPETLKPLNP